MCSQLRGRMGGLPTCIVCGKKFLLHELFVAAPDLRWCAACVTDEQRQQAKTYTEACKAEQTKRSARSQARQATIAAASELEKAAALKARKEARRLAQRERRRLARDKAAQEEAAKAKERERTLAQAEKEKQEAEAMAVREAAHAKRVEADRERYFERLRADYQRKVADMREVYDDPSYWPGTEFLACTPSTYPITAGHAQMCPVL